MFSFTNPIMDPVSYAQQVGESIICLFVVRIGFWSDSQLSWLNTCVVYSVTAGQWWDGATKSAKNYFGNFLP
jgi:hypothetical protein